MSQARTAMLAVVRRMIADLAPPPLFGHVEDVLLGMGEDQEDLVVVTWAGQQVPVHAARHRSYTDPQQGDVVHLAFVARIPVALGAVVAFPPA